MNTLTNTQSRRKSIAGYEAQLRAREERESQKTATLDEHKRKVAEQEEVDSQRNINILCGMIQNNYNAMVKCGKDLRQNQDELREKRKEEELHFATADENYIYKEVDESVSKKMNMRRIAYYALPALDTFFAWFALYPIITAKSEELSSLGCNPIVIGVFASILVGLGLSLLSRMAVSFYDKTGKKAIGKIAGFIPVFVAMICLPCMYIVGELVFNGGESWAYSGSFAFVSFVIQLLIVTGYDKQNDAFAYYRDQKQNESIKNVKEADERAIQNEIKSLQEKTTFIENTFNAEYNSFSNKFRELAAARDEFIRTYGKEPKYYLNQITIYVGNLVCFRRILIPLSYDENGAISTIPFVNFPHMDGCEEFFASKDFVYLDYMLQQSHMGLSLSETIRIIEERRRPGLESPEVEDPGSTESSSPDGADSATTNNREQASPASNEESETFSDDDSEDGGFWE